MIKPATDFFFTKRRMLLPVLLGGCLLAGGCKSNPVTTWSTETKSPDGRWVAMARSEQWSGPGNNFDATTVTLKQAQSSQPPVEILLFEEDHAAMNLEMTWVSSTHLAVSYGSGAKVDFQAVKAFGEVEITLQNLSDGARALSPQAN